MTAEEYLAEVNRRDPAESVTEALARINRVRADRMLQNLVDACGISLAELKARAAAGNTRGPR